MKRIKLFRMGSLLFCAFAASEASAATPVASLFNQAGTPTLVSDNSASLLINVDGSTDGGGGATVTPGDILVNIVGLNSIVATTIGSGTVYNELTAISAVKIATEQDVDLGPAGPDDSFGSQNIDLWEFTNIPLDAGDSAYFDWATGEIDIDANGTPEYTFTPVVGASNDGKVIAALFEDGLQNYNRDTSIQAGLFSVTDGEQRLVVGLDAANNDFLSVRAPKSIAQFLTVPVKTAIDNSNIALDATILAQSWPGIAFEDNFTGGNGGYSSAAGVSGGWPIFGNLDFTFTTKRPSLIIEKTPDADDEPKPVFGPGDTAYFEIKVTNNGPGSANNVVITDDLPTSTGLGDLNWTVASETPNLGVCSIDVNDQLTCNVGTLIEGASFTVRVEAMIPDTQQFTLLLLAPSTFNATDGNLLLDNSEIPVGAGKPASDDKDWESFVGQIDCSINKGCVLDAPSGANDDSYTGGAKEDTLNPAVSTGSIPPSKDDLLRWYFQEEFISGEAFLYLGWVRSNELATATLDFELNQSSDTMPNGVTAVRTEGDVLIVYDVQGGKVINIDMLRWLTAAGGHTDSDCEAGGGTLPCWGNKVDLDASGIAEGSINFFDNGTTKPGDDGYSVFDPIVNTTIGKLRFGEAAINLSEALGHGEDPCLVFTQANVKSRASNSFTSELKDFIAPVPVELTSCEKIDNTAISTSSDAPQVSDDGSIFINAVDVNN